MRATTERKVLGRLNFQVEGVLRGGVIEGNSADSSMYGSPG